MLSIITLLSVKHIKSTDGFSGLYRGLVPRICEGFVGQATASAVHEVGRISSKIDSCMR